MSIVTVFTAVPAEHLWQMLLTNYSLVGMGASLVTAVGELLLPLPLLILAVYTLFLSKTKVGAVVLAVGFGLLGGVMALNLLGSTVGLWVPVKRLVLLSLGGGWEALFAGNSATQEMVILASQLRSALESGLGQIVSCLLYAIMTAACAALTVFSLFGLRPRVLTGLSAALAVVATGGFVCRSLGSVIGMVLSVVRYFTPVSVVDQLTATPPINAVGPILAAFPFCAIMISIAAIVLILAVDHTPVCLFASKKKTEAVAEV